MPLFDRQLGAGATGDRGQSRGEAVGVVFRNEVIQPAVQQLLVGVPKELLQGGIRSGDPAVGLDEGDAYGRVIEYCPEAGLAGEHGGVRPLTRAGLTGQESVRIRVGSPCSSNYDAYGGRPATVRAINPGARRRTSKTAPLKSQRIPATLCICTDSRHLGWSRQYWIAARVACSSDEPSIG